MSEQSRDVKRLLGVFGAGILGAILLAVFFVLFYGPSGQYRVTTVLLEPDILGQLNYNDFNPKIANDDRYVFDKILFFSPEGEEKFISVDQYGKIYQLIQGDRSVDGSQAKNAFEIEPPLRLVLYVKTESPERWQSDSKVFQEIQFSALGDFYRVYLREDNQGEHWAYYHHHEITKAVAEILKQ